MAEKSNLNVLFFTKWDESTARRWLQKIFDHYDKDHNGFLDRDEVNDWREKTTHRKFYEPLKSDGAWKENLRVQFGIDLGDGPARISFEQLWQVYRAQDAAAAYVGGNTLFTDIWHMLDKGIISDNSLVPHVTLTSPCSRCGQRKKLIEFHGVAADVRGRGGQWLRSDQDRVCIDCEPEAAFKSVTRAFELNGVEFEYRFLWLPPDAVEPPPIAPQKVEKTRLYVDGLLVGRIEYTEEVLTGNYVARTFFDNKPVKVVSFFKLVDTEPREDVVAENRAEAKTYFSRLAQRCDTNTHSLGLILSDLFLFPNPYQIADIFALDEKK